jgi:hypothetical protein
MILSSLFKDLAKKTNADLIFDKLSIVLLFLLFVLLSSLILINIFDSTKVRDVEVTEISLGGDCSKNKTGCKPSLICVKNPSGGYWCSNQ